MNTPHLVIRATPRESYGENDELEIEVGIRGLVLSGAASIFDDHQVLNELQKGVATFPPRVGERQTLVFGIFNRFALELTVEDKGRIKVASRLKIFLTEKQSDFEVLETTFFCDFSAIDDFARSLRAFAPNASCEATLTGRPWHDA